VLYLDIFVLMHSSAGLVTGPAMLSLHINNLNSRKMNHQYIQEPILSLNHFYYNIHSIIHAVCYWCDVFLLSFFYVSMFVISYLFFHEDISVCIPLFLILQNMVQGHVCRRTSDLFKYATILYCWCTNFDICFNP
jgi:hypothetical protein